MQPRPGYREDTPRRVVARATEYPAKFELKRHCHLSLITVTSHASAPGTIHFLANDRARSSVASPPG